MKLKKRFIVLFFIVIVLLVIIYFLIPKVAGVKAEGVKSIPSEGSSGTSTVLKADRTVPKGQNLAFKGYYNATTSFPEIKAAVETEFGVGHVMVRVAYAESGFNPTIKNKTNGVAKGVFQILPSTFKSNGCLGDVLKAEDNIACSRILYNKYGLQPWKESEGMW